MSLFARGTQAGRLFNDFESISAAQSAAASFEISRAIPAASLGAVALSPKLTTAFPGPDGVGDIKVFNPLTTAGVIGVGPDDAPNVRGPGVPTVTVHPIGTAMSPATRTVGTIEMNGDQDFRQVTLVAGKTYEIHMYALAGGPNLVPLPDAYIEIYDPNGNMTPADGGAMTPANEVNSGFDVLLTFVAPVSGTYYINSRGFDNDPTDGTTGEGVGDYELFVREADPADPNTYQPYYDTDSPLHSIDWGSRLINKIHQTVRNPDGDEGPRDTGNAQGTPGPYTGPNQGVSTGNPNGFANAPATYDDPLVDSVADADSNPIGDPTPVTFTVPGKNVITVYFARAGEEYKFDDPSQPGLTEIVPAQGFEPYEIDAMRNALASYSQVADIVYVEVEQAYVPADLSNPQNGMRAYADLTILLYNGTFRTGLLGRHSPPDEGNEGQGEYNKLGPGWEPGKLVPGGYSFVTLIHELGHAHGLAHPHDTGGGSSIMRGVEPEGVAFDYTTGLYDLNQAVFTVMSYEDGWPKSPYGNAPTDAGYGYQLGLSAFDIAVIQDKYGVNEEYHAGDDVYVLPEVNATAVLNSDGTVQTKATGYLTIWDAGGNDEIRYEGARNAVIDLRPATLRYEVGGGGWMSYTTGANPVYAGFTIANGATIENARSGSGNDILTGNEAGNRLGAGAGDDKLMLQFGGDDRAYGGEGNDVFYAGGALNSADLIDGGAGTVDVLVLQGDYWGAKAVTLGDVTGIENINLLARDNNAFGGAGTGFYSYDLTIQNSNVAGGATLKINGGTLRDGENFRFDGRAETDGSFYILAGHGIDEILGGGGNDTFLFAEAGRFGAGDRLDGGGGYDNMVLRGNYTIDFNAVGFAGSIVNVESVTFASGQDTRFGSPLAGEADYAVTVSDAMLAAGQTMTWNGGFLAANETMVFDGSLESSGHFRLVGGLAGDTLTGGGGQDLIYGNAGADTLKGNGGADTFRYDKTSESTGSSMDIILDFGLGDVLDLSRIDANSNVDGNQAFSFIGSAAFTNQAGQLRAYEDPNNAGRWFIEGDVDGNGTADMVIRLDNPAHAPVATDFSF
jgi:serralysin